MLICHDIFLSVRCGGAAATQNQQRRSPAILQIRNGRLQKMDGKPINQKTFAGGLIGTVVVVGGIAAGTAAGASGNSNQMSTQMVKKGEKLTVADLDFDIWLPKKTTNLRLDCVGPLDLFSNLQKNGKGTKDTLQMYGIDDGGNGKTTAMNIAAGMDGVCVVQIDPDDWWKAIRGSDSLKKDYKKLGLRILERQSDKHLEHIIFFIDEINDSKTADKAWFKKNSTAMKALPELTNKSGRKVTSHLATFGNLRSKKEAGFKGFISEDYPDGIFIHPNKNNGNAFERRLVKIDGFDGEKNALELMASYLLLQWVAGYNKSKQLYRIKFDQEHLSAIAKVIKDLKLYETYGDTKAITVGAWINKGEGILWNYMKLVSSDPGKGNFKMFVGDYTRRFLKYIMQQMASADDDTKKVLGSILCTMDRMAKRINDGTMTMQQLRDQFCKNITINTKIDLGLTLPSWLENSEYLELEVTKGYDGKYTLKVGNKNMTPQRALGDIENCVNKLNKSKLPKKSRTMPILKKKRKQFGGEKSNRSPSRVTRRGSHHLPMRKRKSNSRNSSYTSIEKNRMQFSKTLGSNELNKHKY